MDKNDSRNDDSMKTRDLHVRIPWGLAERVRLYAVENKTNINNVLIEALDTFLREQNK